MLNQKRRSSYFSCGLILLILAGGGFFLTSRKLTKLTHQALEQEQKSTIPSTTSYAQTVAQRLLVPRGEPTVTLLSNLESLKQRDADFYKDALSGDVLLAWPEMIVLYSPSRDLILAVRSLTAEIAVPIATTISPLPTSETTSTPFTYQIEIRNGSGIRGMGKRIADDAKSAGLNVVHVQDAAHRYPQTLAVNNADNAPLNLPSELVSIFNTYGVQMLPVTSTSAIPSEKNLRGNVILILGEDLTLP
jgi:hypothetical protein